MHYFQIWFKNRRAKWRKKERNQLQEYKNAAAFGMNFMPAPYDPHDFYSNQLTAGYYSNWTKMTTSPLAPGKAPFPWSFNPNAAAVTANPATAMVPNMNINASLNPSPPCPYGTTSTTQYMYGRDTATSGLSQFRLKHSPQTNSLGYSAAAFRTPGTIQGACHYPMDRQL